MKFSGFTPTGVRILDQYNYLQGLPVIRVLHEKTKKTGKITRHENAPRPELPKVVKNALTFEEPTTD